MPEHGEAVARLVGGLAGVVQVPLVEAEKAVLRRQVQSQRHVVQCNVIMMNVLVEVAAAAAKKKKKMLDTTNKKRHKGPLNPKPIVLGDRRW